MPQDEFDLTNRRALVTGASRGIGRAIAIGLARHGASVAVHYASREAEANAVVKEIKGLGSKAVAVAVGGNLAELDAPGRIFDQATSALGGIDILVLNASIQYREAWDKITPEQFEGQVNVNFRASLLLMQRAIPPMMQRKWGRVLAVGSVQQIKPNTVMAVYAGTKAAQMSLVRNIASQVAHAGVTVNNLAPGVIETERNADAMSDPKRVARLRELIKVGFIGQPEDCVGAALLLCSDAGRYITGADLLVDGGFSF